MCDLSTVTGFAQIASGCAAVIGVPLVAYYAWETTKLRRISQKQLDATRSPVVFLDNPIRDTVEGWEGIDIVNGGGGPALNVEYRVGAKDERWAPLPALMSGERRKIPHNIGDMLTHAIRNGEPEATISVRYIGWSGELQESSAALRSTDETTFQLKVQKAGFVVR